MGKEGREGKKERKSGKEVRKEGEKEKQLSPLFTHTKVLRKSGLFSASLETTEEV